MSPTIRDRIVGAYLALSDSPGEDFVKLVDIRRILADIPTAQLDAALDTLYRRQVINLIPQSNQFTLTKEQRDQAVHIGGEDKHLLSIEHI